MPRMMLDCRTVPSENGCGVLLAGEPEEVVRAAVAHAVDAHGHRDDEELRAALRAALRPASDEVAAAGGFVQIIDFHTRQIEDFDVQVGQWAAAIGAARAVRWAISGTDRDEPGRYLQIVEFPDHAAAMANSAHPATTELADRLRKLCDGEVVFRNLDVRAVTAY